MALLNINIQDLPESQSFEPIPEGWYQANIAGAELKQTKNGNGEYLAIRYDILGPQYQGRVIFGNVNLKNINSKAEEIGRRQLGDLMRACGLKNLQDSDQLLGHNVQIKVKVSEPRDGYDAQNQINGFKSLNESPKPAPTVSQKTTPQTTPKAATKAPWAK